MIDFAGSVVGVDPRILSAVAAAESSFNPNAVSKAGAQGLFQFMPDTAKGFGITNPFDPLQSALGGAIYLRQLHDEFGSWPLAFAAYNAGAGAVRQYHGIPPFAETRTYVDRIMGLLGGKA